ncbi:MAG: PAS domain S-box protein [Limisphaerales bacterium]
MKKLLAGLLHKLLPRLPELPTQSKRQKSQNDLELCFQERTAAQVETTRHLEGEIAIRQQAEEQLVASLKENKDLKTALDEHAIVAITDPQGRITHVNDKFCAISKYAREELLGQDHRILNSGYHSKEFMHHLWTTIGQGQVWHGEIKNKAKDGTFYWVDSAIVPCLGLDGKPRRYVAIRNDVTERKRAEEALRWRTTLFEALVESSLDGILVVDSQGKKILQNQQLNDIWKIPPHIAQDPDDAKQVKFIAPLTKNSHQFAEKVADLYAHSDQVSHDEIDLIDGRVLDRYSSPARDKTGTYYGRIWMFRDMTERRQLESQLRQAQKMEAIGQLAGGIAHDFNNILCANLMHLGLLQQNPQLTVGVKKSLEEVGREILRAANLTRQLLLFSRQQAARIESWELDTLIDDLLNMLRRLLGENIEVTFQSGTASSWVSADAGMIQQVVMNLCINARDAMPSGGRLILETRGVEIEAPTEVSHAEARPGRFVCLSVTDTGCGMDEAVLAKIFVPFFTTKEVGKGTGLGLATVYGIVKQHQGWIEVESELGQGSCFRVYFPASRPLCSAGTSSVEANVEGGSETILLVEDELFLRQLTALSLRKLGYAVFEAGNGLEALKVWEEHHQKIALLLTDMKMPGEMTGLDLAVRLKRDKDSLKVISCSGYNADLKDSLLAAGREIDHSPKPFTPNALAKIVRRCLDKS